MAGYWKKRAIDLENLLQKRTNATIIQTNKLYQSSLEQITKDIEKILSTFRNKSELTKTEALTLLNVQYTREIRSYLIDMYNSIDDVDVKKEIQTRLSAPAYASRIRRLEAMKDLVYTEALMIGVDVSKTFEGRMISTYKESYYRNTFNIQQDVGYQYDFSKISNNNVKAALSHNWLGSNYSKRLWKDTQKLAKTLEGVIEKGLMTGTTIPKMVTAVSKEMESGRNITNRLIRTEVAYISGQGRKMSYEEAELERYIFIATLDLKTSMVCREQDGNIYFVKDAVVGKNFPPLHPNCRSVDGAYIENKDRSKLKRRAIDPTAGESMLVPQTMTYKEWYNKYILN